MGRIKQFKKKLNNKLYTSVISLTVNTFNKEVITLDKDACTLAVNNGNVAFTLLFIFNSNKVYVRPYIVRMQHNPLYSEIVNTNPIFGITDLQTFKYWLELKKKEDICIRAEKLQN